MKSTKIMIWVACLVMILGLFVAGHSQEEKEVLKTYNAITEGCEVETKEEVVVEQITIIERRVKYTLQEIEGLISFYSTYADYFAGQLEQIQGIIEDLNDLKAAIEKEVETVELKPPTGVNM